MEYIGNITFDDKLHQSEQIVICGAGKILPNLLTALNMMHLRDKVVAICDSNTGLWEKDINKIPVNSYGKVIQNYPNADYIVYNRFAVEISHEISTKVRKIHFLIWRNY